MKSLLTCLLALLVSATSAARAGEIVVRVDNLPPEGVLVLQVYDNANTFGDFRNPLIERRYDIQPDGTYVITDVPGGQIAVLGYLDENRNNALDRNFIGIPREPLGLSNNYQPKGPPSFSRASFPFRDGEVREISLEIYQVLGERGQWGVGLGVIAQSSPYVGSDTTTTQVIPAVTYFGERLQWVGPNLRYGILGSDRLRLAITASYRLGAYEEDDSRFLQGLGDRDSTLMAGLGVIYEWQEGTELDVSYEHDVLDNIGGGIAEISLSKGFQLGNVRLSPQVGINWLSSDLADYEYGVPVFAALPNRPAYSVNSAITFEAGVGGLIEITEDWRVALSVSIEMLDDEITDSPIVGDDIEINGFAALTYTF